MQARVLQAIIHHQHLRAGSHGGARAGGPVGADPGRRDIGEQQRLIADLRGGVAGLDAVRSTHRAAVAAQQEVDGTPASGEPRTEIERQRGLARAAHGDVAAADHWHRCAPSWLAPCARP